MKTKCGHEGVIYDQDRGEEYCGTCGLVLQEGMVGKDEVPVKAGVTSTYMGVIKPIKGEIQIGKKTVDVCGLTRVSDGYVYVGKYATLFLKKDMIYERLRKGKTRDRVKTLLRVMRLQNSMLSRDDMCTIIQKSKGGITEALRGISDKIEYTNSNNTNKRPIGVFFTPGSGKEEYHNLGAGLVGAFKHQIAKACSDARY